MQKKLSAGTSFGIKACIIAGISLALLIPAAMLSSVVRERQRLSLDVQEDIIKGAGGNPRIAGPYLIVPVDIIVNEIVDDIADGKVVKVYRDTIKRKEAVIFPRNLSINGKMLTEERSRGIYTAAVFNGAFDFNAVFDIQEEKIRKLFTENVDHIYFENSRLGIGISDPKIFKEVPTITMPDGTTLELIANLTSWGITNSALEAGVSVYQGQLELDFTMEIGGGGTISFLPIGLGTDVQLEADWPTPSFMGGNAPVLREINNEGFTAEWKQPRGTGKYPEYFVPGSQNLPHSYETSMGVEFFDSVGVYHKTERALKYALLFIVVPFAVILLFEVFSKKRIHPIQYIFVGIADIVFYALLLSLAEQMHFTLAYCVAAGGVIMLITFYTGAVLKNFKRGIILVPILAFLYGYLYSALQSQDYALLIGSVGMFVILAAVMIITRNIDWYSLGGKKSRDKAASLETVLFPEEITYTEEETGDTETNDSV